MIRSILLRVATASAVLAGLLWLSLNPTLSVVRGDPPAAVTAPPATASAVPAGAAADRATAARTRQEIVARGIEFLRTKGQTPEGAFTPATGPSVTALVTAGVLRNGRSPQDPLVAKSLKYIEGFIQKDGGIYNPGSTYRNYETCIAMVCLSEANQDGRYTEQLAAADRYVKGLQWNEDEGHERSSTYYGGAGYGRHERPDLSNTSFLIDALKAAGNGPDDPAMQRALVFVSRCQNLETEHNTTEFAAKNPDGGFYYTPASGGTSQAGENPTGGLRSYASMTYAGLKSMIYAGVQADDERVQAAIAWLSKHYDLRSNPGMGDAGLYYYYHTLAKALDALGKHEFVDASGKVHDWRSELIMTLADQQNADGSWTNSNSRWMEGDSNLVTGYALLALSYCRDPEAPAAETPAAAPTGKTSATGAAPTDGAAAETAKQAHGWEKTIARFEAADRQNPPAKGGILFVGSSTIRLWDLEKSFPGFDALNRGFGGSQLSDTLHLADRIVVPYEPRVIVFYAGANDIAQGKSIDQLTAEFRQLLGKFHTALPKTRVIFLPVKPSVARWRSVEKERDFNARVEALAADDPLLDYVDVATPMLGPDGLPRADLLVNDGLHHNEAGYALLSQILKPHLVPYAPASANPGPAAIPGPTNPDSANTGPVGTGSAATAN